MSETITIGQIVAYHHPGSADGKFPPCQSPAMIQKVNHDWTVDLIVFSVHNGIFFNKGVFQGDMPGDWNWIPKNA